MYQIFIISFNSSDQLIYARKAYDHILRTGRQPYINYALCDLLNAYCNNRDTASIARLMPQFIDSAAKYQDPALMGEAFRIQGYAALWYYDADAAMENFGVLYDNGAANTKDSLWLAEAYAIAGNTEAARRYLQNVQEPDSNLYTIVAYNIYRKEGDFENALTMLEKISGYSEEMLKSRAKEDLLSTTISYHEHSREKLKYELKVSRLTIWIWVIVSHRYSAYNSDRIS